MDDHLAADLRKISEGGYANGFLACLVRITEEVVRDRNCTAESLIAKLTQEARQLPGYREAEKA